MTSALRWWLYSTYFPSEISSKNTRKKKEPVKSILSKREIRNDITAAEQKLTVGQSTKASTEDDYGKTCRVCLKDGEIPIYANGPEISEAVKLFGGIKIDEVDQFPKHLCGACYSMLQSAVLFRKKAKESEKLLRENCKFTNFVKLECEQDSSYKLVLEAIKQEPPSQESESDFAFEESNDFESSRTEQKQTKTKDTNSHKNSKEYKDTPKLCKICNKYVWSTLYEQHSQRHKSTTPLICEICGKIYKNLEQHVKLHSSDLPFHCKICPYRGNTESNFKIHMRTHTGDKPYACKECGYHCTTKSNLSRHESKHKGKRFKCNKCVKTFYSQSDLQSHKKSVHFCTKLFECGECGNNFGSRSDLLRHGLKVHKRKKMKKGKIPLYLQNE